MKDDTRELTRADFAGAISRRQRERIIRGEIEGGEDITALRRFTGLTQRAFAAALGISVHTLRNWEQGRRSPEGPALALLRIAARHPRVLRENLATGRYGPGVKVHGDRPFTR
jgi:putative transcriptional regulator